MSIIRRSALRGDEVVPFQCIHWPDDTVQRRTVSVEYVCSGGVTASLRTQNGRSCPVSRIGRCRVDPTKPGTRKPSRSVKVYELMVRETQRRWYHEDLVEVSAPAQMESTATESSVVSQTPDALADVLAPPHIIQSSPCISTPLGVPFVPMQPAFKRVRREVLPSDSSVDAARRVGAALGRGDFRGAITLVIDIHDMFPHAHLSVMQQLSASRDGAAALAVLEKRAETECEGPDKVIAALREGFNSTCTMTPMSQREAPPQLHPGAPVLPALESPSPASSLAPHPFPDLSIPSLFAPL